MSVFTENPIYFAASTTGLGSPLHLYLLTAALKTSKTSISWHRVEPLFLPSPNSKGTETLTSFSLCSTMTLCPWLFLHQMGTWSIVSSSSAEAKKFSRVLHTSLALMKPPFPSARTELTMKGVNLKRFNFFFNWYLQCTSQRHRVGFCGNSRFSVSPRSAPFSPMTPPGHWKWHIQVTKKSLRS